MSTSEFFDDENLDDLVDNLDDSDNESNQSNESADESINVTSNKFNSLTRSYISDYIENWISSIKGGIVGDGRSGGIVVDERSGGKDDQKFNFYEFMDKMNYNKDNIWIPTPSEFANVEKRGKLMELLTFKQDYRYDNIKIGYTVVEKFLKQNSKILVGGMSIHMAFEEKGEKLYIVEDIDYDFITDTFSADAYRIGFEVGNIVDDVEKVSVIGAMHHSTMRVRYDFAVLADITYFPTSVLNRVETLETKSGFRIIHPHFQMIDQHRALSSLYENAPLETIIGDRVSKDMDRYIKLSALYPIETRINSSKSKKSGGKSTTSQSIQVPIQLLKDNCISGMAAVKYWLSLINNVDFKLDKSGLSVNLDGYPLALLSDNYENVLKNLPGDKKYYRALLDKLPRHIKITNKDLGNVELYDSLGVMISAIELKIDSNIVYVADMQFSMMYLLLQGLHFKDVKCLEIYIELRDKFIDSVKTLNYKFLPTMSVYGKFDHAGSYDMNISRIIARNYGNKTKNNAHLLNPNTDLPTNYYPKKGIDSIPPKLLEFNPEKSSLLFLDGEECELFEPNVHPIV